MTTLGATQSTVEMPTRTYVSTQFDKVANTSLADITGLTATVTAGATYLFEAILYMAADNTGGFSVDFNGTATATAFAAEGVTFNAAGVVDQLRVTGLAALVANDTLATTPLLRATGFITVNAGGTLTVRFAQKVANGVSSVLVGSSFTVSPIA